MLTAGQASSGTQRRPLAGCLWCRNRLVFEKLRPLATLGFAFNSIRQRRPQRGAILSQRIGSRYAGVVAGSVFSRLAVRGNVDWTPQRLTWSGLMMAWSETPQLVERFAAVRACLHEACPHWKLGASYDGYVQAQQREAARLIPAVTRKLRQHMQAFPEEHRRVGRWEVFAVDGSDAACPRTIANQQAMGDTGKPNGIPQLSMTVLFHVGLAMPWAFRVGPSTESEREHLRDMFDELLAQSLLVGDAGFIGYGLCREMHGRNQHFLLRVGGNVHLLTGLGYHYEVEGETVYLWPLEQQSRRQPPIKLRLLVVEDEGKQPIYLVTSVLDAERLTLAEAGEIYRRRWGIEVSFRTLMQTLAHTATHSRTPENCYLEMKWAILGAWMLELLTVRQVVAAGSTAQKASPAAARNVVRRAMRNSPPCGRRTRRGRSRRRRRFARPSLLAALAACQTDNYRRTRPKASRDYPRKKRHEPPSPPKIKPSTESQRQIAKQLTTLTAAP